MRAMLDRMQGLTRCRRVRPCLSAMMRLGAMPYLLNKRHSKLAGLAVALGLQNLVENIAS
jgi:hypothetical protein